MVSFFVVVFLKEGGGGNYMFQEERNHPQEKEAPIRQRTRKARIPLRKNLFLQGNWVRPHHLSFS